MIKLLPYILFEKNIYNLASLAASPGNRHCANCIGTLSFPISCRVSGTKACASDSALLTIVRVYKIYLLTYLDESFVHGETWAKPAMHRCLFPACGSCLYVWCDCAI